MATSGNNKTIAKNTAYLYIRMTFALAVSLYTSRVVINTLGVEDYGINNVVAGFVSMFVFLNSSLTASIQRYYNYENSLNGRKGVIRVYKVAILVQFLLAFLVLLLVESIGLWYLNNKLVIPIERLASATVLFHTTVLSMLILIMQVPYSAVIMSHEKMDYYALVGILDTVLRLTIVLVLPYVPYDKLIVYGFLGLTVSVFDYSMYFVYTKRNFKELSFDFNIDNTMLKSMIAFSGWNSFGSFAIMLRNQGLNMIINLFFGPVVNAARGVAYSIQSAMLGFIQNISISTRPQLTEAYARGDTLRSMNLTYGLSKVNFILLYLMALPIISEINYILKLWLGGAIPEHTNEFVLLVLSIALVDVLNTPVSIIMLATGKVSHFNTVASVIGLLSLPLSYFWLYIGGSPNTVFYVSLFVSIVVQYACVKIMCETINTSLLDYSKIVIIPLCLLIVFTFWIGEIPKLFFRESFLRLFLTILLSSILVLTTSYFIVLNSSEKKLCGEYVKKIIRSKL